MNIKIEKMEFGHRELERCDGRHFKGHTLQMDHFSANTNLVNVEIKNGGQPVYIVPCTAKGNTTGIAISADLEQGLMRMEPGIESEGIVTFSVDVQGNPYRREPWLNIILYVTENECYEALEKIILPDRIILVFQVLHIK